MPPARWLITTAPHVTRESKERKCKPKRLCWRQPARRDRPGDNPRVGFGAWAIGGGGWEFGWGPQADDESIAAIHHALDLDVNWIDTAAVYGFGRSEQVVGRALEGLGAGQRPLVFTKSSLLEGPGGRVVSNLERDSILREAEASLRRLRVDAIDLYQIHWPVPDEDIEEGWAAFAELKEQGRVRHIGVSNFSVEQLRRHSGSLRSKPCSRPTH